MDENKLEKVEAWKVDTCKNCKHFVFLVEKGEGFICMLGHKLKEKRVEGFYRGMEYSYHLDGPESGFCEKEFIQEHDQDHDHVFG